MKDFSQFVTFRNLGNSPEIGDLSMPGTALAVALPGIVNAANGSPEASGGKKPTVKVRRRRRTESDSPEERRRAEAPRRRREEGERGTQPPSGTGGSSRPPSGSIPGGRKPPPLLMIVVIILISVCVLPLMRIFSPGDSDDTDFSTLPPSESQEAIGPKPAGATPMPFESANTTAQGQTWLVMLYQDADDKILEQDIYVDLNEAERIGSTERVQIVAQVDRYQAGFQGDGDWTSAKRFYVTRDDDLQRVRSQVLVELGEVNMSDGQTLIDFISWAVSSYPADKYALIMSDHGMGWPGGWSDPAPGTAFDSDIPLASRLGDELYLMELDESLGRVRAQLGLDQFELVGMDACLMGHLEVFAALAPHARYAVASQETEPALGWAYTAFLEALQANPDMSGAELGRWIVDSYIQDDQRIVDEQARDELLRQGSPLNGLFSVLGGGMTAGQLARQMEQNVTLTAADLSALPELMESVNQLSFSLQTANQAAIAQARTYAQSFTSVFGSNVPAAYLDLGSLAELLKRESGSSDVARAADGVLAALDRMVVAEKHGPNKAGASGVSIYFPNSQLYRSPITGPESYTAIARRFAEDSLWDEFLAYHYAGRRFDTATVAATVPDPGSRVVAPGFGQIEVLPITLSDNVAAPRRPVLLSTDVRGQNVGYVQLFVGFYDDTSSSIFVADTDYLESPSTREIDGVYYPDWGEAGEFTIEFEWEPLMFAINDGVNSVIAALTPRSYGAAPEDAVYTVDGVYTYMGDGESRHVRLFFQDGILRQLFGFTGEQGVGAPREIIPQAGDSFTVLEQWMDLDPNGQVVETTAQEGGTLIFGDEMFRWEELDAAPGAYVVGFIVQDLDGNNYEAYTSILVE